MNWSCCLKIHVLNLPIRILKFLHCNCALCEGQKGQNSLSPSHLIKICRLNLNISYDPAVSVGVTLPPLLHVGIIFTTHCAGVTLSLPTSQVWALLVTRCDVLSVTGRALLRGHTNKFVTFIGHVQLTWDSHTWAQHVLHLL